MRKYSLEEQASLLDGLDVWHTKSLDGIPSILMADGPHGLRKQIDAHDNLGLAGSIQATAFPTASLLACSWDETIISEVAKAIALEAKANQVNVLLGPAINIKRSPLCGRNFEYFSEDPLLTAKLAQTYVRSVESIGIGTSVKHFCCNNQERLRFTQNSIVDERALNEIYLKGFHACVKENPATIMASYNQVNGKYATESPQLKEILRNNWQYKGVVVTDWGACNNRVAGLLQCCDLEMPSSKGYHTKQIINAAKKSVEIQQAVENSFERIQTLANKYAYDSKHTFNKDVHHEIAKKAASESMVLLKNEGAILPLKNEDKVAILGGFIGNPRYQGGGSSHINPLQLETIIQVCETYNKNIILSQGYNISDDKLNYKLLEEAIRVASSVNKVVVILGLPPRFETEGIDRKTIDLPKMQIDFLYRILEINPNVIVCIQAGSVVNLSFANDVKGILICYLAGQANAQAMLDILWGRVNPSGRLAETFIDDINHCNIMLHDNQNVMYDESIYVGYRYYNTYQQPVRYPFGYGLSYTKFSYSNMKISSEVIEDELIVSITIKNTGDCLGKEVVQLYIENNHSSVYKPKRELKSFKKITLKKDEEIEVFFTLEKNDFAYYDVFMKKYHVDAGIYKVQFAKNVNNIICEKSIICKESDPNFKEHPHTSYHKQTYDTTDFIRIYQREIPYVHYPTRRPFTISSTLHDIEKTRIGKLIVKTIVKKAKKVQQNTTEEWMQDILQTTLKEMPLRTLAMMSGGALPIGVAEGLIDIVNLSFIKGILKVIRSIKHEKNMV